LLNKVKVSSGYSEDYGFQLITMGLINEWWGEISLYGVNSIN
jgi:hypothetical protein